MNKAKIGVHESQESVEPPVKRSRRGRIYVTVTIATVLAIVLVGAVIARRDDVSAVKSSTEKPVQTPDDVIQTTLEQMNQIRVEPVRERTIDLNLETTGKVGFNEDRMTPVFAPYGGRVLELLANKGDVVQAGQPLLVVDSPDLVATVNDLSQAKADEDKARIALDAAEKAAQRARSLNSLEALATKELQAAESDLARSQEDLRRAEAAVSVMRSRLALFGKSPDEVRQLEQSVPDQIDRRVVVRAPLAGTIVDRKVGPGQYVKPDTADPLYLISDLSTVWVSADVYETHLSEIRIGAPVEIRVPAYADRVFAAHVSAINPTVDKDTRTVHVRCLAQNAAGLLKPEMFANIRIDSGTKRKVSAVPSTAVLTQGSESFVLVEDKPGRFRRRLVKPGPETQGYTVVEDGLASDNRVVTAGALLLYNGLGKE